jgi:hypothetical protein
MLLELLTTRRRWLKEPRMRHQTGNVLKEKENKWRFDNYIDIFLKQFSLYCYTLLRHAYKKCPRPHTTEKYFVFLQLFIFFPMKLWFYISRYLRQKGKKPHVVNCGKMVDWYLSAIFCRSIRGLQGENLPNTSYVLSNVSTYVSQIK